MPRPKLTLPEDRPLVFKLDAGPEGVERRSQYGSGVEYQYTVNDDQNIVYLKPEAREAILQSGAQAGDRISMAKFRRGNTNYYDVKVLSDAVEPAPLPVPIPATPPVIAPLTKAADEKSLARPAAATLAASLYSAVDAVLAAEEYARTKGRALAFSSEDVRCMALSIYISAERGIRA